MDAISGHDRLILNRLRPVHTKIDLIDDRSRAVYAGALFVKIDYGYHYRKWNKDTDEARARVAELYSRVYGEHFPADKSARILDVGCGIGYMLGALRTMGYTNASGIDIDPGQVDTCLKRGLDVTLVADSKNCLRENAGSFDQILAFDLIEHVPHEAQLELVGAMAGALKPGGTLVCTTPNANSFLGMRYRYIDWTHCEAFTEHSLDFLLHSGGFGEIQILPAEKMERPKLWFLPTGESRFYWAWRLVRGWRRLQFMVELGPQAGRAIPLSANLLAVAKKA